MCNQASSVHSHLNLKNPLGYKILENSEIGILTWINHISKFIPQKSSELRQLPERSENFQLKHQFLNKLHLKIDDPAFIFS